MKKAIGYLSGCFHFGKYHFLEKRYIMKKFIGLVIWVIAVQAIDILFINPFGFWKALFLILAGCAINEAIKFAGNLIFNLKD